MPITPALFRKSAIAAGTVALGLALVAGTGITSASAAGTITSIKLFANDAGFYAGSTHSFTVYGYDSDGNLVDDETANATLTSNQSDDVIAGATVKLGAPATHIIKASLAAFPTATKGSLALPVVAGPVAGLTVSPADSSVTLNSLHTFTTKTVDADGYARGTVTATYSSSSSHDKVRGGNITFGSYGTRTITARWTDTKNDNHHWVGTTTVVVGKKFTPAFHFAGTFASGHTVTSTVTGTSGKGAKITRQWFRDGVAIDGATAKTLSITSGDIGHAITLKIVIKAKNYITYNYTSKARSITV